MTTASAPSLCACVNAAASHRRLACVRWFISLVWAGGVVVQRLREQLLLASAERIPGRGEEDRSDEIEVGDRIAIGVIDGIPGGVVDVAAFTGLVAVSPFVVARGINERILEGGPQ